jgi:hypothetical protein
LEQQNFGWQRKGLDFGLDAKRPPGLKFLPLKNALAYSAKSAKDEEKRVS